MSGAGRRLLCGLSSGFAKAVQSGSSEAHRAVGVAGEYLVVIHRTIQQTWTAAAVTTHWPNPLHEA